MTAKQALHERIESLSEEEAAELLARIDWDSTEYEELTTDEAAEVAASQSEYQRGESVDGDDALRRLGLCLGATR
jgi:hypothetical protein